MGGDKRLAQADEDYGAQIMDDVQYGRSGTRIPIPYRHGAEGPQFDPKDVPILPGQRGQYFDPNYGTSNLRYIAGVNQPDHTALFDVLRRLLIRGKDGGSYG